MPRPRRALLAALILLAAAALVALACRFVARPAAPYARLPAMSSEIVDLVMLGDSLTDWGHWSALLPGVRLANHGVAGDTTEDVFARLGRVTSLRPRAVALLVGINDLLRGRELPAVAAGIAAIAARLARELPGAVILVQTVFPVAPHLLDAHLIDDTNARLSAALAGHGVRLIDVSAGMRQAPAEWLAEDGLHLSFEGYQRWAVALRPHVDAALGR
jgi:lysophospholipase L1-like esterase